jgi:hypothetical protein
VQHTVERISLWDLDEKRKVTVRIRPRDIRNRDREDQLQHIVRTVGKIHARLRLVTRKLGLGKL